MIEHCDSYWEIDVVPNLIERLRQRAYPPHVAFKCANIVTDELPEGTVCLIRQVLQHLTNSEIALILPKLRRFQYVVVTKHFPTAARFIRPNVDKAHGPGVRASRGSAVCLEAPPFNVQASDIVQLLEVPGDGNRGDPAAGAIRTFVFPGTAVPAPEPASANR